MAKKKPMYDTQKPPALKFKARIDLTLPAEVVGEGIEIPIRNERGALQGTLVVFRGGLVYKHPKQKTPAANVLTWDFLAKASLVF